MTKIIKAKTTNNQFIWMISPDILVNPFRRKNGFTYLDVFYQFAQHLISVVLKKQPLKDEGKRNTDVRQKILIELNNKVIQLKFFAKALQKQEKKLLQGATNTKKKIYNYKPYQVFLGLSEAYLSTVYGIRYWLNDIDKALGKKFSEAIWKEEWFKLNYDLRNLLQHIESPLASIENGKIYLSFKRVDELDNPKYFTEEVKAKIKEPNGRYTILVEGYDIGDDMLRFLDSWAKQYINLLDEKEEINTIDGFYKNGRTKSKKVSLKELKNKVENLYV